MKSILIMAGIFFTFLPFLTITFLIIKDSGWVSALKIWGMTMWIVLSIGFGVILIVNPFRYYKTPPLFIGTVRVYDANENNLLVDWHIWEGDTEFVYPSAKYRLTFEKGE